MFTKGKECGDPCKNMYTLDGVPPPCESCYPEPLSANREAVRVYNLVANQVITAGMGEVIGLDYTAVAWIMKLRKVQDKLDCLERLNIIFNRIQELREQ